MIDPAIAGSRREACDDLCSTDESDKQARDLMGVGLRVDTESSGCIIIAYGAARKMTG
ncbi:protein of unknown function [Methylocaldum szegediense]|uniref:Uncharacterized protein n=1 Tax=Methylocaldum szegediense TaxID=73780 RepID=A0ABM9I7X9_9GAMM|nr:protein of unknown function [Methylocaldum szegediense]